MNGGTRSSDRVILELSNDAFIPEEDALVCVDEQVCWRESCLPVRVDGETLTIALTDSADLMARDRILATLSSGWKIEWQPTRPVDIARGLARCYGFAGLLEPSIERAASVRSASLDSGAIHDVDTAIVELVDRVLECALLARASDIHLCPEEHCLRLRLRVDGLLFTLHTLDRALLPMLSVRIKILAGMDIAETRLPQDGQFSRLLHEERVDFRVSSFPVRTGENLVVRVLDRRNLPSGVDALDLELVTMDQLRRLALRDAGLLVVAGPTGSGKSTTLHALLAEHDAESRNIMTLEDPVEYAVPGLRQASVDEHRRLGFAEGLRGLMRQDPDVLLIGEIRDKATCAMALRAALSGHQVLTTVHADTVFSVVERLRALGAEPVQLAAALGGIVAQRLVRRCCSACIAAAESEASHARDACRLCRGSGFLGRRVVLEVLEMNGGLAESIARSESPGELEKRAISRGFRSLRAHAAMLVETGQTTSHEVQRVLGMADAVPSPSIAMAGVASAGAEP